MPETYVGSVVELFAQRKGEMVDMQPSIEVSHARLASRLQSAHWSGQRTVLVDVVGKVDVSLCCLDQSLLDASDRIAHCVHCLCEA